MAQSTLIRWLLLGMTLAACGCASDKDTATVRGLSSEDADKLNAGRSKFDTKADPPFTANTHFAAARLAESQDQPQVAIEQYQAGLAVDPKHQPSLYCLALLYVNLKDYTQAAAVWQQYISATEGAAIGYGYLGLTQELAGKKEAAETSFQNGIKIDDKCQTCRVNYGLMLARQGRIEEAEAQFTAVLTPAQSQYNLASVYEKQGQIDKAVAAYKKALELDPTLQAAQVRLKALAK